MKIKAIVKDKCVYIEELSKKLNKNSRNYNFLIKFFFHYIIEKKV